jgi:hypothetical protein
MKVYRTFHIVGKAIRKAQQKYAYLLKIEQKRAFILRGPIFEERI